jgi:hypothetical protein
MGLLRAVAPELQPDNQGPGGRVGKPRKDGSSPASGRWMRPTGPGARAMAGGGALECRLGEGRPSGQLTVPYCGPGMTAVLVRMGAVLAAVVAVVVRMVVLGTAMRMTWRTSMPCSRRSRR